jgi:hypothetical protein
MACLCGGQETLTQDKTSVQTRPVVRMRSVDTLDQT